MEKKAVVVDSTIGFGGVTQPLNGSTFFFLQDNSPIEIKRNVKIVAFISVVFEFPKKNVEPFLIL
jgi:hypothetical protein